MRHRRGGSLQAWAATCLLLGACSSGANRDDTELAAVAPTEGPAMAIPEAASGGGGAAANPPVSTVEPSGGSPESSATTGGAPTTPPSSPTEPGGTASPPPTVDETGGGGAGGRPEPSAPAASGGAFASGGGAPPAPSGGASGADGLGSAEGGGAGGTGSETPPSTAEPIGFATLNGGTTGGADGETVVAASYAELKSYAESSGPLVILIQGTISNGENGGVIRVAGTKSLIGMGSDAFLDGIGLDIRENDVIVQNLRISLVGITTRTDTEGVYSSTGDEGRPQILVNGGDAISISGSAHNIWIDHCELFSEDPDVQTNRDLYDGLIDIKNQTGFITISWNYFHDHHKGNLVGASDDDLFDDRKITFHHNHYENVKLRIPTMRGSVAHFFNNYVVGAEDASEIRANTCVRVEKNYYEALHYSIYTPSDAPGRTERIDNVEVDRESRDYPDDCVADVPYDYEDALIQVTDDVKGLVPAGAGVGRL